MSNNKREAYAHKALFGGGMIVDQHPVPPNKAYILATNVCELGDSSCSPIGGFPFLV